MNEQRLTELDRAKVYVDGFGRKWVFGPQWWQLGDSIHYRFSDSELRGLFPDLCEHVPAWYEDAVAKGWAWNAKAERLVRVGFKGQFLTIENDKGTFWLWVYKCPASEEASECSGTLDECLAAAEPLIWKGEAK